MTWFDLLLTGIFLMHVLSGFMRGLVKQLFDVFGFIIVVLLSLWGSRYFSEELSAYIDPEKIIPHHEIIESLGLEVALEKAPQIVAGLIAFLAMFLILSLVFKLFSGGFRWINRIPVIGFFNRVGGLLLGTLIGIVFVYIIIAVIALIPLPFFEEILESSQIVFIANYYLAPLVENSKEFLYNFYITHNG